jgi:hypothetical protein
MATIPNQWDNLGDTFTHRQMLAKVAQPQRSGLKMARLKFAGSDISQAVISSGSLCPLANVTGDTDD